MAVMRTRGWCIEPLEVQANPCDYSPSERTRHFTPRRQTNKKVTPKPERKYWNLSSLRGTHHTPRRGLCEQTKGHRKDSRSANIIVLHPQTHTLTQHKHSNSVEDGVWNNQTHHTLRRGLSQQKRSQKKTVRAQTSLHCTPRLTHTHSTHSQSRSVEDAAIAIE